MGTQWEGERRTGTERRRGRTELARGSEEAVEERVGRAPQPEDGASKKEENKRNFEFASCEFKATT